MSHQNFCIKLNDAELMNITDVNNQVASIKWHHSVNPQDLHAIAESAQYRIQIKGEEGLGI